MEGAYSHNKGYMIGMSRYPQLMTNASRLGMRSFEHVAVQRFGNSKQFGEELTTDIFEVFYKPLSPWHPQHACAYAKYSLHVTSA